MSVTISCQPRARLATPQCPTLARRRGVDRPAPAGGPPRFDAHVLASRSATHDASLTALFPRGNIGATVASDRIAENVSVICDVCRSQSRANLERGLPRRNVRLSPGDAASTDPHRLGVLRDLTRTFWQAGPPPTTHP